MEQVFTTCRVAIAYASMNKKDWHKAFGEEKDLIGRVYEYFLKEFAVNATKEEGEMKARKHRRKMAGYISLQAAEVYLGRTGRNLSVVMLPFEGDKLPQNTKEAF